MRRFGRWLLLGLLALPAHAAVLFGEVVNAEDEGVAGLDVYGWVYGENVLLGPVSTNDRGLFALDYQPQETGATRVGVLTVRTTQGLGWWSGEPAGKVRLLLQPVSEATGRVVDKEGHPLAGVAVAPSVIHAPTRDYAGSLRVPVTVPKLSSATDAAGRWLLLLTDGGAAVTFTHPDYALATVELTATSPAQLLTTLVPGGTLAGVVRGLDGQPVPGLRLRLDGPTRNVPWVTTDAAGKFQFGSLAPGRYTIRHGGSEVLDGVLPRRTGLVVKASQTLGKIDLQLVPGVPVRATIVEQGTDTPVPELLVQVNSESGYQRQAADAQGQARFRVLPGDIEAVWADAYQHPDWVAVEGSRAKLTVPDRPGPVAVKLVVQRAVTIRGRFVDQAGQPVAGLPARFFTDRSRAEITSGPDGRFELPGMPPTGRLHGRLGPRSEPSLYRFAHADQWELSELHGELRVELVLPPTGELTGRVVDLASQPVAGITVELQARAPLGPWEDGAGRSVALLPAAPRTTTTDADGRFTFDGLSRDWRCTLAVRSDTCRLRLGGEVPDDGPPFEAEEMVVQQLDQRLTGVVANAAGKPVAGAEVFVSGLRREPFVVTAADGRFELSSVPDDEVLVVALSGERASGVAKARPGGGEVRVEVAQRPVEERSEPTVEEHSLAVRLAEQALVTEKSGRYGPLLAMVDPQVMLVHLDKLSTMDRLFTLGYTLRELARRSPDEALAVLPVLEQVKIPQAKAGLQGALAEVLAATRPAEAKELAVAARAGIGPPTGGAMLILPSAAVLAATAKTAGLSEAETLLQAWLPSWQKTIGQDQDAWAMIAFLLGGHQPLFEVVAKALPGHLDQLRGGHLVAVARRDAQAALVLWHQWYGTTGELGSADDGRSMLNQAAVCTVEGLAVTEPVAALALARRLASSDARGRALACVGWRLPDREQALEVLAEASQLGNHSLGRATRAIARFDRAAALPYAQRLLNLSRRMRGEPQVLLAAGFYLANVLPNEARRLVEDARRQFVEVGQSERQCHELPAVLARFDLAEAEAALAELKRTAPNQYVSALPELVQWLNSSGVARLDRPAGEWFAEWEVW